MSTLEAFRDPASVAVVGATDDRTKWGYWMARGALRGAHRRAVHLVNRTASRVQGRPAHSSLTLLPDVPELVVVCVPAQFVESIVSEALERGSRAFLVITAGVPDEGRIAAMIRAAGGRIIGPNTLGLYDSTTELQLAWGSFAPGALAIVSQSGQLGLEIAGLAARSGLGVSRFVSIGNQTDVDAAEILHGLIDDDATQMVALYLESFAGGSHLMRTIRSLALAGKQTIIVTIGASQGSQRLARSHTGSLTSALDTVDAACRAAGAIRVSTPTELVQLARYLSVAPHPAGGRVGIISDSGGQGGVAADLAVASGLSTPVFSQELQATLAATLPAGASVANPVDLAGAGEASMGVYADLSSILLGSGEVDAVVVSGYWGCYGEDTPSLKDAELAVIERMVSSSRSWGLPLVVHSMSIDSPAVDRMWLGGIPVFPAIETVMRVTAQAAQLAMFRGREITKPDGDTRVVADGYWAARGLLDDLGVAVPSGVLIGSTDWVDRVAAELVPPFVLKAGWLAHKSEHDAIAMGLDSMDALIVSYDLMRSRLGEGEYVVEEQDRRVDVVEVLVGGRQSSAFGPLVVVGAGGVDAELHRDVCVELAPVDRVTALSMIGRLMCLPLLEGWRGRSAVDIEALAQVIVVVSEAIAANVDMDEFEINPVRVAPDGALAVDALVVRAQPSENNSVKEMTW